jgi:hypothetical protein
VFISSAVANVELAYIKVDVAKNIAIDIKTGGSPTTVNPDSDAAVQVAILTTGSLDAATVDPRTVSFGATGTEAVPVRAAWQDIDHDGDNDLIVQFQARQTGIRCGDVTATLTAKTFSARTSREAIQFERFRAADGAI